MSGYSSKYSGKDIDEAVGQQLSSHVTSGNTLTGNAWYRIVECQDIMAAPQALLLKVQTLWNNNSPAVCMFAIAISDVNFIVKTLIAMRRNASYCISKIRMVKQSNSAFIDVYMQSVNNSMIVDLQMHNPSYAFVNNPIVAAADDNVFKEYDIQYID